MIHSTDLAEITIMDQNGISDIGLRNMRLLLNGFASTPECLLFSRLASTIRRQPVATTTPN